ncbi:MAG: hypothetical protein ACO1TE_27565 [Prosthecobacter sp.]
MNSVTAAFGTPQAVVMSGVLAGKTITRLLAGQGHAAVVCSNGSMAAWGAGTAGQLGSNTVVDSRVPVAVTGAILGGTDAFVSAAGGAQAAHTLTVVGTAVNAPMIVVEHPSGAVLADNAANGASFSGNVVGSTRSLTFTIRNTGTQVLSGVLASLSGAGAAHYAVTTPPAVSVPPGDSTLITLTFSPTNFGSKPVRLGIASSVGGDLSPFDINITGSGDPELHAAWLTGAEVPAQAGSFDSSSREIIFTLGFAPPTGTTLMVLNNTGTDFIGGYFDSADYGQLGQGQEVEMVFGGTTYKFIADYYGGDGNDLVLQWAGSRLLAWGAGTGGQLGNRASANSSLPVVVDMTTTTPNPNPSALVGKRVLHVACGANHSVVLCSDGTLAAWGTNALGQLGNNGATGPSNVPVPVLQGSGSVLNSKLVVGIAAGTDFTLALCSDGSVVAWGRNLEGQLGNGDLGNNSPAPVLVTSTGPATGNLVTAIAAGGTHAVARCSDGRLLAWGSNGSGQLGNGEFTNSGVPVAVTMNGGVLQGKKAARLAAGYTFSQAICTDGTHVAWGDNTYGALGSGDLISSTTPVLVATSGVLAGRTAAQIGGGQFHSTWLGRDGSLAIWGRNNSSQFGVATATIEDSAAPFAVPLTGALAGKTPAMLATGRNHHIVLLTDGTLAAWGTAGVGQLGNGATTPSPTVPSVPVSLTELSAGEKVVRVTSGTGALHNIAMVAKPLTLPGGPPVVSTNPATAVGKTSATLNGLVNPNSLATGAQFQYGLASGTYGPPTTEQTLGSGSSSVSVTHNISSLQPNTTYYYRVIASNTGGPATGNELTFTTLPDPPTATASPASNVGNDNATLNAIINPNGHDTTVKVQVAFDAAFNTVLNTYTVNGVTAAEGTVARSFTIGTGLFPGTTYYYRMSATNQAGSTNPDTQNVVSFTTTTTGIATAAPAVTGLTSSNVGTTTARLQGFVNQQGSTLGEAFFEWGMVGAGYTSFTTPVIAVSGGTPQLVVDDIESLLPATQYQYRLVARNNFNTQSTTFSDPQTFTTLPLPPDAVTLSATALSTTSARLHGTVNAKNGSAAVIFEWSTDGTSWSSLPATSSPVTGSVNTPVSADLTNLLQFTTYHFRVKAATTGGTTTGGVLTFQPQIISGLVQDFPEAPPASGGSLTVTLAPAGLLSGWRFVGEHRWRPSGETAAGLVQGSRMVEFRPVPGYLQPGARSIDILSTNQSEDFEYILTSSSGTGGIVMTLQPRTLAEASQVEQRGQWRLLGASIWHDALPENSTTLTGLEAGSYLVEFKPVTGYSTPPILSVTISSGQTINPTVVYANETFTPGALPAVLSFSTVSTDDTKPYGYVGQIRSRSGVGTGFAVRERVVATAAHVVFDDVSHASVEGLQWLPQEHAGGHEPLPITPRGYYLIDGYSTLREGETPGSFSLESRQKDVAALYFTNTTAVREGFSGFLASDLNNNEFLLSGAPKMLVGYPVDGIATPDQGRMHATAAANLAFAGLTDRVFVTEGIRSTGGNSGGPLCVQHTDGSWYPAAIYLGGATQSIVRAIDSKVIQLFDTAEESAVDDEGYTGGGITHTGYVASDASDTGSLVVNITPSVGTGWRPEGSLKSVTLSGNARANMTAGTFLIEFAPVAGYQTPASQSVQVIAGSTQTYAIEYLPIQSPQESWRQTHFGSSANSGNGADSADPDGDGFNNLAEYTAGTHPTTASDHFKAQNPTRGAGTFSVSTAGKAGRTYHLQRSATPAAAGSWTDVATQGPLSADASVTLTDAASPAGSAFYRIRVTGPEAP